MDGHITAVLTSTVDGLQVVTLGNQTVQEGSRLQSFKAFTSTSRPTPQEQSNVARICAEIKPDDLLNLQFTSGMPSFHQYITSTNPTQAQQAPPKPPC